MSNIEFYHRFNRDIFTNVFIPSFREASNPIQYNNRPIITNSDKNPLDNSNLDHLISERKNKFHFLTGLVIEVSAFMTVSQLLNVFEDKKLPVSLFTFISQRKRIPILNSNDILISVFPEEKVTILLALGNCTPTQINYV